jgi:VWFA-related protein
MRAVAGKPASLSVGLFALCLTSIILFLFPTTLRAGIPQQSESLQYDVSVVNIEVPVRVYDGDSFVGNLTIKDFEVFENGVPQTIEALYLIKNAALERKEGGLPFAPKTVRNFFLFFQVYTPNPKIGEGVDYFVRNVLKPGDRLTVVTSLKTYRLKKEMLEESPKDRIGQQLTELVKHDTLAGNLEYMSLLNELKRMVTEGGVDSTGARQPDLSLYGEGSWQEFLMNYRDIRERLEKIRRLDGERLLSFADYLKKTDGQKIVIVFYQREYVPMVDRKKYIGAFESGEDILVEQDFKDLFDLYKRDQKLDTERIKRTFADASISVHFLFVTTAPEHVGGLADAAMEEHSEDLYSPFLEMAKATGGLAESSSNPASLMKASGTAAENYYLLYYKPSSPSADGKFREIKVVVKNKPYRVLHRAGYFAK